MSHTPTTGPTAPTNPAAGAATGPGPIQLACPSCACAEHLHTVELVEVLAEASFTLGQSEPHYGGGAEVVPDTYRWQPDTGAIECRHCDQVDLRYGDLIPAVSLTDTARVRTAPAHAPTPGATS